MPGAASTATPPPALTHAHRIHPQAECIHAEGPSLPRHEPDSWRVRDSVRDDSASASDPDATERSWGEGGQEGGGGRGGFRLPGEVPNEEEAAADFTNYGKLPAGYELREVCAPELSEVPA